MLKLNSNYSDYTDETDVNYPEGKAVNASSSESYDGTPLLAEFMNDVNASHIAMYEKAYGERTGISGKADTQKSSQFADAVAKYTDDKVKAHTDQRGLANGVHGATADAIAGQIVSRDEYGRAKVAAPVEDGDIANKKWVLETIYPVGSLYWSSKATNPFTLFGGTWVQIKDKFILAAGDTYKAGATGGSATVKLTESNLPAHSHGMNHHHYTSGTTGENNRGHTHGFSHTHGINHTHTRGTMEIQGSFNGLQCGRNGFSSTGAFSGTVKDHSGTWDDDTDSMNVTFKASNGWTGSTSGASNTSTSSQSTSTTGGISQSHTHTWGNWSGDSYTTANNSTARSNTDSTGSGTAFSILPPYVVMYCFERTA